MVKVLTYHSYTKDRRFLIADMHPSHIVNALAVINEGRHEKYCIGDHVYVALVTQLLISVKDGAKKRAAAKVHHAQPRLQQSHRGFRSLAELRTTAERLAKVHGYVAADTLRNYMTALGFGHQPGLDYMNVLRGKAFLRIGRKKSTYPLAKGREIQVYVLA